MTSTFWKAVVLKWKRLEIRPDVFSNALRDLHNICQNDSCISSPDGFLTAGRGLLDSWTLRPLSLT